MGWTEGRSGAGAEVAVQELVDAAGCDAVLALVETGALVSLGLSRDRGALAATVTFDGEWQREWFRDSATLTDWLVDVRLAIEAYASQPAPSGPGRRSRGSRARQNGA